ncbi:unnamed protein product [Moneuplotes crassus]|uniref:Uncharacterized protein n=1 Tax=Euplotes crassus TaxID=5936 RepID=A0AAD1UBG6_EUPCR|nr:unnamed protein product [Moneuplotes crassus]
MSKQEFNAQFWSKIQTKVRKDLNEGMEQGKYLSFNYPVINFTEKDKFPSMWGILYNEIYNNEKLSPKKMMQKYKQYQAFEFEINENLSQGKKLPRRMSKKHASNNFQSRRSISFATRISKKKKNTNKSKRLKPDLKKSNYSTDSRNPSHKNVACIQDDSIVKEDMRAGSPMINSLDKKRKRLESHMPNKMDSINSEDSQPTPIDEVEDTSILNLELSKVQRTSLPKNKGFTRKNSLVKRKMHLPRTKKNLEFKQINSTQHHFRPHSRDNDNKSLKIFRGKELARINKMRDFNIRRGTISFKSQQHNHRSLDSRYRTLTQDTIYDSFIKDTNCKLIQLKQRHLAQPVALKQKFLETHSSHFSKEISKIFTLKDSTPVERRPLTKLRGKSKNFSKLEQFDIKDLLQKGSIPISQKHKSLGIKPWLADSTNKLTYFTTKHQVSPGP